MIYEEILRVCEKYLSGDSRKFLDRQISSHLKKEPRNITSEDATEIAKWSKVSGGLLLGQTRAEQMANEILSLLNKKL